MNNNFDGFDEWVRNCAIKLDCPGLVVGVHQANKINFKSAYGFKNVDTQEKMTLETLLPVGSVTKTFTSLAIAMLIEEGAIGMDDRIIDIVPDFILADEYATNNITLRDILSHRLGMPRYTLTCHGVDISLKEYIGKLKYMPLKNGFRSGYIYSNAMYVALGYIIEILSGMLWREFIQVKIFTPLNLNNSHYLPLPNHLMPNIATGYIRKKISDDEFTLDQAEPVPSTALSPGLGGGLVSSVDDLLAWLSLHVDAYNGKGNLIKSENITALHEPHTIVPSTEFRKKISGNVIDCYALGWQVESYKGTKIISHGGCIEGFQARIGFIPDKGISVAILSNITNTNAVNIIFNQAMDLATGTLDRDRSEEFQTELDNWILNHPIKKKQPFTDLTAYEHGKLIGSYEHNAYPTFEVKTIDDTLHGRLGKQCPWGTIVRTPDNEYKWYYKPFNCYIAIEFNDEPEVSEIFVGLEAELDKFSFNRRHIQPRSALTCDTSISIKKSNIAVQSSHDS